MILLLYHEGVGQSILSKKIDKGKIEIWLLERAGAMDWKHTCLLLV